MRNPLVSGFRPGTLAILLGLLGCTTTQVPTPTRVLDRPSDVALFCLDYEFYPDETCPLSAAMLSPPVAVNGAYDPTVDQNYLDSYCNAPLDNTRTPKVTILASQECDGPHRLNLIKPLRDAAIRQGLDPDHPCCPADNVGCGIEPPACVRRTLEALVTNSARDEVALVNTETVVTGLSTIGSIENLQSNRPGFGFLPVGSLPQRIRSYTPAIPTVPAGTKDPGLALCPRPHVPPGQTAPRQEAPFSWAVTTNAGSCDLSLLDLNQVVNLIPDPMDCGPTPQSGVLAGRASCPVRVTPYATDPKKPLLSRPAWVEPLPLDLPANCTGTAPDKRALVAFPTCGLVADIDLSTGQIKEALVFDDKGASVVTDLSTLSCPADCGGGGGGDLMGDADGGRARASTPSSIAVDEENHRILVADSQVGRLTILDYDPGLGKEPRFFPPRQYPLSYTSFPENPRGQLFGADVVRVSPRTAAGKFAYLVARDATVRVFNLDQLRECETNPDPRWLQEQAILGPARVHPDEEISSNLKRLSCFPIGTPRSPLALSPGIPLSGGALPRDVAFVHLDIGCDPGDPNCPYSNQYDTVNNGVTPAAPTNWIGDFAWILASSGSVQAVQIADECPMPSYRACYPDQGTARRVALLRTLQPGQTQDANTAPALPQAVQVIPQDRLGNVRRVLSSRFDDLNPGPRVVADTQGQPFTVRTLTGSSVVIGPVQDPSDPPNQTRNRLVLPALASFTYLPVDPICNLTLADPDHPSTYLAAARRPQTIASFPDPYAVRNNENWTLDWEGALLGLSRTNGRLVTGGQTAPGLPPPDPNQPAPPPHGTLIDQGGLYCRRGVEDGDKLWLNGCNVDTDCDSGQCEREPTRGSLPGICLSGEGQKTICQNATLPLTVDHMVGNDQTVWAAAWTQRYRIIRAEQQQLGANPLDRPQGGSGAVADSLDRLTLAELAEPEFQIEQQRCDDLNIGDPCMLPKEVPPARVFNDGKGHVLPVTDPAPALIHVQQPDGSFLPKPTFCRADLDGKGLTIRRCLVECKNTADCGFGFVCAHSAYEKFELPLKPQNPDDPDPEPRPRCLRAPLIAAGTPIVKNIYNVAQKKYVPTWVPMNEPDAQHIIDACFPSPLSYVVRAGDSFLVHGDLSGAPSPEKVALVQAQGVVPGQCQRPTIADGDIFQYARLYQPRLRLGPKTYTKDAELPVCTGAWISHHVTEDPAVPIPSVPSCNPAASIVTLPDTNMSQLRVVQASTAIDSAKKDPNDPLKRESDLFGMLPLDQTNSCVLTPAAETLTYPGQATCANDPTQCPACPDGSPPPCARRIHFENPAFNLVLQIPRNTLPLPLPATTTFVDDMGKSQSVPVYYKALNSHGATLAGQSATSFVGGEWLAPPEGYAITFVVSGGYLPYAVPALVPAVNQQAQGLRSATAAPDGSVFIVDEGRTSSATGLRGQLMRLFREHIDGSFVVR